MKIYGPHYDRSNDVWKIRWKNPDTGKMRSKSSRKKEVIEAIKAEMQGPVAPAVVGEIPPYDQTASWWNERAGALAEQLLQALGSGDEERIEGLCRASRAWSGLATSARRFVDQVELEKRVESAETYIDEIRQARKHGTGTQGAMERIQPLDGSN